jgi:quinol monooxygenase YgiN
MATTRRDFLKTASGAALMAVVVQSSSILISCKQKPKTMNEKTLLIVAISETSPERAEELKPILLGLIEPTRKENGCISYELYQDTANPGKFTFIEKWKSNELLDAHLKSPHLVAAVEAFNKILTKEMIIMRLDKIA